MQNNELLEMINQLDKQDFELSSDIKLLYDEIKNIEGSFDTSKIEKEIGTLKENISSIQLQKGDKGDKGEKGDKGDKGKDGKNGKDGKDGRNGIDGINGLNGKDGTDGSPDTPEQIVEKINTLENVIERKTIKGLDTVIDKPELDRAIDILDRRTQYLINKTVVAPSATTWASITGTQSDVNVGGFTNDVGYITSSALSGYTPTSRTITINGTAHDLTADRTWSVGTVTSVAALTLGTTGTDLSSTVATGTTTPVITLNVPTASATNRGALSSTDWTTFNNKFTLPSLTAGSVLFSNGTTIAQDNSNFFWDDTNNRLGIGITSPLHSIDTTGNIRINTGSSSYLYFGTTGASISQGILGIDRLLLTAPTSGDIELLTKSNTGVRFQRSSGEIYTSFPDVSTTNQSIIFGGDFYGSYRSVGTSAAVIERNGSDLYLSVNSGLSGGYASFTPNKILTISGANSRVGIGVGSPSAVLHLKAGTATASTAPLKFTSGTNLTTAEAGAIEYNNTFHVTNSDATRRHVVTAPNTTKVTAGAPYTNDGYITINIGGTDFKVMTTA
jgi:hypothetical protein